MTNADKLREMFRKNPSLTTKQAAEQVGCARNTAYAIRKEVLGGASPASCVAQDDTGSDGEVRRLRKQNATLKRLLMSLLAEEL
jgi:hypothetical protein